MKTEPHGSKGRACRRLKTAAWGVALLPLLLAGGASAQTNEFRAFWADAFHNGFKSASQVTTLINDIRAANGNAVVVEVRKRGDAYYNDSIYEPHATDTSPTNFDSLGDLITKAHDTSGGKARIEVHAWIVSFKIWGSQTPPPASVPPHPYNAHPDWLTQDDAGATWDGSYTFDPGHPDVQRHTFNVCMDIISRYDVDGLNFDYIRYSESGSAYGTNHWGYNPVAVARFNARYGKSGQPALNDPDWNQFRRDQVTAVVRKVYLNAIALKPQIKISADTITWSPSVTTDLGWTNSARAYRDVLQDWRAWMEEGILDLNVPMNYYRQSVPNYATDYTNWMNFAKDRRFNRHVVIGPGIYLNSASNAIIQMRATRALSPGGNSADGVCGYSYAVPNSNSIPFATFRTYLTNSPNAQDPIAPAIFSQRVAVPIMPWKATPTTGHLKGMVYGGSTTNPLDGAAFSLAGAVDRTNLTDATGFYGAVDLPPGGYTLTASYSGFAAQTASVVIVAGQVTTQGFILQLPVVPPSPSHIDSITRLPGGATRLQVSGQTGHYGLDASGDLADWAELTNLMATNSPFDFIDQQTNLPRRFYRARWIP